MKHFAIFLCMVIGNVCVDLQRVEIGEDDSKADQDARKAASLDRENACVDSQRVGIGEDDSEADQDARKTASLDRKNACVDLQRFEIGEDDSKADQDARKAASLDADETITEDQAIRPKDLPASTQSSDGTSNETEDSEKPLAAAKSISMTSEVKKSEHETHLGKPVTDLGLVLSHSHQSIASDSIRDTSLKSRVMFAWSYQTKIRGTLAPRNVVDGTIEDLEDLDTYGVITMMVKGYVESSAKIETRLIQSYQEQYCDSAQRLLQDVASGYWIEVVNLRDRHATPLERSAALRKYWDMKVAEFKTYRQGVDTTTMELYMLVEFSQDDCEKGETDECVSTAFSCPNEEMEMKFQTLDLSGIVVILVVILLCMIFGVFILFIYTFRD